MYEKFFTFPNIHGGFGILRTSSAYATLWLVTFIFIHLELVYKFLYSTNNICCSLYFLIL